MTIVYDPLTYRTVVARPGEIPYKFWSVNKHVIDAASAGICTLHSGDEAPGDTSRLWLDLTMPENAVGAVKAYDGASWVALTPALFYSHIAGGAGGFVTDLEMATYVSGLIGVSLQAWGENLDQWSAIDPTAKEDTGVAATLDAAHLAAGDPHPQYLTAAEGAAAYQPLDAELTSLSGASANGVSLVTAANYAAMRALLDLEAGTDFLAPAAIAAAYQPLDSDLTAIAALTTTAFGRAFLAFADEAAFKAGVNLEIGVDVQAYDADLTAWAAVNPSSYSTTAQIAAAYQQLDSDLTAIAALTTTAYGRAFLALADAAAGRTALGLGTLATQNGTFSGTSSGTNTGDQTITLTGDVTGSGTGSFAATLATVNANTGSWGLAGSVAQFVVNAKGLITSAANVAISIASTAISDATAAGRSMLTAANAAAQTALLSAFVGDSGAGGTKGLVPAPIAGDATKFLKGDGTFASIPGGGDALTANPLSQFAATTSLQLKNTISDETGSGALVFATSPTLVTPALGTPSALVLTNATGLPVAGGGTSGTTAETARAGLSAASFDAGAALGLLTNPFFEISQEYGNTAVTLTGSNIYIADQWNGVEFCGGVFSSQVVSDPFSGTATLRRLKSSIKTTATTADASFSAAEALVCAQQPIEGTFWGSLGWGTADARAVDIVIIAQSSVTGTYPVSIRNGAVNRSYVTTISLTANTPTVCLVTIPGDTSGTWVSTNAVAAYLEIGSIGGSNFNATSLNTWEAANKFTHSTCTNWAASGTTDFFQVAYAQVFPAGVLPFTSAAEITGEALQLLLNMRRPYEAELLRCQRYYEKSFDAGTNPAQNAGYNGALFQSACAGAGTSVDFPTRFQAIKRTVPTITLYNPSASNAEIYNTFTGTSFSGSSGSNAGTGGFRAVGISPASTFASHSCAVHYVANARM